MRKRVYTLSEVKSLMNKFSGESVKLKIHHGRNRYSALDGVVTNIYPAVFTVLGDDSVTRTFSYFDVACGDVVCSFLG